MAPRFWRSSTPDPMNNRTTIDVAPWTGQGWDDNCGVVTNFVPTFIADTTFCGLANCSAASSAARHIAAARRALGTSAPPAAPAPADPAFQRLLALADHTAKMDMLPVPPGSGNNDYMQQPLWTLTRVDGRPTLVVFGTWQDGVASDSPEIGYLVSLWQPAADNLSPVAGFRLRSSAALVRSVYVTR